MFTYELIQKLDEISLRRSDGAWIPTDPANSDYAEYLRYTEWVEAGNDPDEFWTRNELLARSAESEEAIPVNIEEL